MPGLFSWDGDGDGWCGWTWCACTRSDEVERVGLLSLLGVGAVVGGVVGFAAVDGGRGRIADNKQEKQYI